MQVSLPAQNTLQKELKIRSALHHKGEGNCSCLTIFWATISRDTLHLKGQRISVLTAYLVHKDNYFLRVHMRSMFF